MKIIFFNFVSSVYFNTCHSVVESILNLKNGIIFSDRREEKIILFFEFKIGFYNRMASIEIYTTINARVNAL